MNKLWFALLHDQQVRAVLDKSELDLIDRYIPYTCEVAKCNVTELVANKNRYFFKRNQSFGGTAVYEGATTPADTLLDLLRDGGALTMTAQEVLDAPAVDFPGDAKSGPEPHHLVFGLYLHNDRSNGMVVRASAHSRVVNVTAGAAKLAWAFCVDESAKGALVSALRVASLPA